MTRYEFRPVTAALLALRPLTDAGLLEGDVIIDAKSGISGAGKKPSERTHFSECHGSVSAYGLFEHRHGAEIEMHEPVCHGGQAGGVPKAEAAAQPAEQQAAKDQFLHQGRQHGDAQDHGQEIDRLAQGLLRR